MNPLGSSWPAAYAAYAARLESCDSTNTWALRHSHEIADDQLPFLVTADLQTGGRGRNGRAWFADQGTLAFSLLDSAHRVGIDTGWLPRMALIAGLAVAEAIEAFVPPLQTRLKWPNDVYVDGGKVAGILVESARGSHRPEVDRFVIGVGVNVSTDLRGADAATRDRARSLAQIAMRPLHRDALLELILERLQENVSALTSGSAAGLTDSFTDQRGGGPVDQVDLASSDHSPAASSKEFSDVIDAIRKRCLLTGHSVVWQQAGRTVRGRCLGIDASGALRVATDGGVLTVQTGEIVRLDVGSPS